MAQNLPKYLEITETSGIAISHFLKKNKYSNVFILVDENTGHYCLPLVSEYLGKYQKIEIKSGEIHKTLKTCEFIWQSLTDAEADRNALLINIGGGVIGDMGGFCASTYKRGIDFVNIPTTLLSQVDASIGGKLGIDFHGFKNHIGVFRLPKKVIVDPWFLKTLPLNEIRSGFAEMLKHAFIKDLRYMNQLNGIKLTDDNWLTFIEHSIQLKNQVVEADPEEKGERKVLNFGHTIGHAIETHFLETSRPILHGEAVAAGMIAEAYLSTKLTGLSESERNELVQLIDSYFTRIELKKSDIDNVLVNMEQDKKNLGTEIQAVLLTKLGEAQHSVTISHDDVREALAFYGIK